jgi:hypothetical protein
MNYSYIDVVTDIPHNPILRIPCRIVGPDEG